MIQYFSTIPKLRHIETCFNGKLKNGEIDVCPIHHLSHLRIIMVHSKTAKLLKKPEGLIYHSPGCSVAKPWVMIYGCLGFGAHFCIFAKIVTKPDRLMIVYRFEQSLLKTPVINILQNHATIIDVLLGKSKRL